MNQIKALIEESNKYLSWTLTNEQLNNVELILNNSFDPLSGFNNKKDYDSIISSMRLTNGNLWPIPINLDVDTDFIKKIKNESKITLRDNEGFPIAILNIQDIWRPNLKHESESIFETLNSSHPGVAKNLKKNPFYIGGSLKKISLPNHYDFKKYRHSPKSLKKKFIKNNWNKVLGFQTNSILHRCEFEMILSESNKIGAKILIHPSVGLKNDENLEYFTRIKCYEHILKKFPKNQAKLSLIPLTPKMAGPKECILHALIRKNYGCSHFIIDKNQAILKIEKKPSAFYEYEKIQKLLIDYKSEIGIKTNLSGSMVFNLDSKKYQDINTVNNKNYKNPSKIDVKRILNKGGNFPNWFTFNSISNELKKHNPPLNKKGLTVFFTGLSGSGKSTLSNGLMVKLLEEGSRKVTLLDGDLVRSHLSSELGFSKEHRSINVKRIGFVASEIVKNEGIAICSPIAPYEKDRSKVRKLIEKNGAYIEIFVNTPLKKCEERDAKGLYSLARKGKINKFTGISAPYETPLNPDIIVDSSIKKPKKIINEIYDKIQKLGYDLRRN